MFIVTDQPDWLPGMNFRGTQQTLEDAKEWATEELNALSMEGIEATFYIRQVDLGDQLKYASSIVVEVKATAYPEEG